MKIAVISDIHGNLEAFDAVWRDISAQTVDAVYNLGDCVGYGPEPEAVLRSIRRRRIATIMGNHELAAVEPERLGWFNPKARKSLRWTVKMLTPQALDFIRMLPRSTTARNCRFVHGYPPDSAHIYLFTVEDEKLAATMAAMDERICFVGHTHSLEYVRFDGRCVTRRPLHHGILRLDSKCRYIMNIGSVGQPRDGDSHAKYAVFDDSAQTLEIRFVAYDIARVVNKILAAGLPEAHANCLW